MSFFSASNFFLLLRFTGVTGLSVVAALSVVFLVDLLFEGFLTSSVLDSDGVFLSSLEFLLEKAKEGVLLIT